MARRHRDPARRLRIAVDALPTRTKGAMLRGMESNRIIVGAYVDPSSGGICPMLAAHRNGGRTSVASFARAWDEYTDARRPRRATRREVTTLRSLLETSLGRGEDSELDHLPISQLAAQIRAERERLGCTPATTSAGPDATPTLAPATAQQPAPTAEPEPEFRVIRRPARSTVGTRGSWSWLRSADRDDDLDLLAAAEQQLAGSPNRD